MRFFILLILFTLYNLAFATDEVTISGKVSHSQGCSNKVMVWLSLDESSYKDRLLLMHTEVPNGGSFKFYVKPGSYQVRATDESGCEYLKRITATEKDSHLKIKLVKK